MIHTANHVYKRMHDHDIHDKSCLPTSMTMIYMTNHVYKQMHDHDTHGKSCLQTDA